MNQVPDSDADDLGVVYVAGKSVRAPTLALELSISQITGAARPALGCKVSPRLAQRGCELVVSLVREVRHGRYPRRCGCPDRSPVKLTLHAMRLESITISPWELGQRETCKVP